jgi:hypothetical protein
MLCEIEPPEYSRVKTALAFVLRACDFCQVLQTKAEMVRYEQVTTAPFFILGYSSFINTLPSNAVCNSSYLKQLNDTKAKEHAIKI